MTVLLVGVGADSTNAVPIPPVDPDGRFEYIPIPEATDTTETATYGSLPLRHEEGTLAEYLTAIDPDGTGSHSVTGEDLTRWPVHHDPNFAALTYGESPSRPAYTSVLETLTPGDCVAFYTGLSGPAESRTHRYLIGYFTVDTVYQIPDTPPETACSVLPANAHCKRFEATGEVAPGTVLIDGTTPGGRLPRAQQISTHRGGGHYYLRPALVDRWQPIERGDPDRPPYLGGIKQIHTLQVAPETFRADVDPTGAAEQTVPS